MTGNRDRVKFSVLGGMALVAAAAVVVRVVLLPGFEVLRESRHYTPTSSLNLNSHVHELGVSPRPFWPQYWRRLRGIPEPDDVEEIFRSDDGGLAALGVAVLAVALSASVPPGRRFLARLCCPLRGPGLLALRISVGVARFCARWIYRILFFSYRND